ncbi:MAG: XRE family transcriptional regulator [Lachnospiraceae bacterium]|nr:XRE family transcriptional regulator [Lachnospiraceae bacterium]
MGKKSTRENKNIYQQCRENLELTRDKASDLLEYISADRIEKIESERSLPHPDEILTMSQSYKAPYLCNYYCSHECPIGKHYVPEIQEKESSTIILEMLASLNSINDKKARLIEIMADGVISDDQIHDFVIIQNELEKISISVESLQLWLEKTIMEKQINIERLEKTRKELLGE